MSSCTDSSILTYLPRALVFSICFSLIMMRPIIFLDEWSCPFEPAALIDLRRNNLHKLDGFSWFWIHICQYRDITTAIRSSASYMLTNENSCLSNFAPVYLLIKIGIKIQENRKIHMGNVTSMTVLCIFGVTVSPSVFLY